MEESRDTVALSRLIRRETFYKEKALKVEKDLIFAKEQIGALEARIQDLTKEESEQKEAFIEELKAQISGLTKRIEEESGLFKARETELLTEIEQFKEAQAKTQANPSYQEKVASYEKLLTDIQVTINEKEREVIIYKARLESLEKRLKHQNVLADFERPKMDESSASHTNGPLAISYIEHALILSDEECLIRGECVIENVGTQSLDTPLICFRMSPLDVVHFKGKFQGGPADETLLAGEMDLSWSFVQNDWAMEAREREEIWLTPNRPIQLEPGETQRVPGLQLAIQRKYCERVTIEGFIYFKGLDYRIRMVNPIIINF